MARTGEDRMRHLVHLVCRLLAKETGLAGIIATTYPSVATALAALQAACSTTGFDKTPEIEP